MQHWKSAILLGWATLAGSLHAELSFESDNIEIEATTDMTESVGVFKFTNTGDKPVAITNVRTSCGCTAAAPEKDVYAPGESGEIKAVFQFGERQGRQQKHIAVTTDEGQYSLNLVTVIPGRYEMEPRLLAWIDDGRATKSATVTFLAGQPVELLDFNAPEGYEVQVETLKEGEQYRIDVTPTAEKLPTSQVLRFAGKNEEGKKENLTLFLRHIDRQLRTSSTN
ncbi:MAG: DUF1573 domain-containing protein [Verrucomicrobiota bacterium JB022]|nr:DUF1573 domain-containing protein [Verrucomicrobiota bacterium JB022]